jgi:vacuolar-type H+-ATPase subunit F/Vma7
MGFRMVGLRRTYEIDDDIEVEALATFLKELCKEDKIGIIAITENLLNRVENLSNRSSPPIILKIPKLQRPVFPDVKEYYRKQITDALGFGIEL